MILSGCSGNDLDGTWVWQHDNFTHTITFDGNNFTANAGFIGLRGDGTFSITSGLTNDNIEFVFSDGRVVVREFIRTENTFTLRGGGLIAAVFVRQ
jgi:hypothetical protein